MPGDYEVGKGKPPKHTRWKQGQSGNPKGRPPKPRPDAASVVAVLDGLIPVKKGGAEDKMPAFEASVRKLVSRAVNHGDVQAAEEFLRLCDKYDVVAPAPEPADSPLLIVPKSWDWNEWLERFEAERLPPWRGKHSGMPE